MRSVDSINNRTTVSTTWLQITSRCSCQHSTSSRQLVPHIPLYLWTRQKNTLDPEVQQHLEWLSFNWKTYVSSSSSPTWTVARQRMVGSAIRTTTPESRTDLYKETCTGRSSQSEKVSNVVKFTWIGIPFVVLRICQIFCSFWKFHVQTVATAMNATEGVQITPDRTHARARHIWSHAWLKGLTVLCVSRQVISSLVMSLLNVPSTPFPPIFSSPSTHRRHWLEDRLAIWPIRVQTQVLSPSSASVSVASTRRSTFRPETGVSSNSTTRQSPLRRTSIYLDIREHQAAASTRQQALFPLRSN